MKRKKRVKRKERVKKMRERERKKKKKTKSVFMLRRVMSRVFFIQTFVLLYNEASFNTNNLEESLPSVVVSLLQEYEDVVPNDLPPIRGIEHQIDFAPSVTIPIRPTYMSNPEEIKELQR